MVFNACIVFRCFFLFPGPAEIIERSVVQKTVSARVLNAVRICLMMLVPLPAGFMCFWALT